MRPVSVLRWNRSAILMVVVCLGCGEGGRRSDPVGEAGVKHDSGPTRDGSTEAGPDGRMDDGGRGKPDGEAGKPMERDCGEFELMSSSGACRYCGDCTAAREQGLSTGRVFVAPGGMSSFTNQSHCMCEATPGAFASEGESVRLLPCDADGDGWIRESARAALGIDHNGQRLPTSDPVLRANARCTPRIVDRVVLHSDISAFDSEGHEIEVPLEEPLVLVESDRNDDDSSLATELSNYGVGMQRFSAAELNGFTKACGVDDHNDNGLSDVDEWDERPNATATPLIRRLQRFGYFVELATSWYEESKAGAPHGAYHIREHARSPSAGEWLALPLTYAPTDGSAYWRQCMRRKSYTGSGAPNQDFARHWWSPDAVLRDGFAGLHHAQFKCLRVVASANEVGPATPQVVAKGATGASLLRWNACGKVNTRRQGGGSVATPEFNCSPITNPDLAEGEVRWAALNFQVEAEPGEPPAGLVLDGGKVGCIDECAERPAYRDLTNCAECKPGPFGAGSVTQGVGGAKAGMDCGRCGGVWQCDGTCSKPEPANYDQPCNRCLGKVKCDGTCSSVEPSNYGQPCSRCGGTITCAGTCSIADPHNLGAPCGRCDAGTVQCDGVSCSKERPDWLDQPCGSCGGRKTGGPGGCDANFCSVDTPSDLGTIKTFPMPPLPPGKTHQVDFACCWIDETVTLGDACEPGYEFYDASRNYKSGGGSCDIVEMGGGSSCYIRVRYHNNGTDGAQCDFLIRERRICN